jgi:hypothetical protein
MIRRRTIDILAVAAVVFTLGAAAYHVLAAGEDRKTAAPTQAAAAQTAVGQAAGKHDMHGEHFDKCAKACADCQLACSSCAAHCAGLLADGKKEHGKTLRTCLDCADHCAAAAQIVSRRGPFSDLICKACADACARCGKACAQHSADAHMKACADECRRCEKACRTMIEQTGHVHPKAETK